MSFKELSIMPDKNGTVLFYPYIPKKSVQIIKKTLSTRWIGQGPMVEKFEKKFSLVQVVDSSWSDHISIGKWFICYK